MKQPIVVVGGGPAGSICALRLVRLGHQVILAERSIQAAPRLGETCGPRIRRLLEGDCALSLPRAIYAPIDTFYSAWGSAEIDGRSFAFWQAEDGLVLDRKAFDEWLLTAAESSGVTVMRGCQITAGVWRKNGWMLSALIDGNARTLSSSFVVEATGPIGRSVVQSDVNRYFSDALVCLAVHLPRQSPEERAVMIESCPSGWWYMVSLPDGTQIVALFTDADLIEHADTRLDWFNSNLQATSHIRNHVQEIPKDTDVHVCDARTSVRSVIWRDAFISAGDAAWCLDPLSGTGIERGIKDGLAVAAAVSQSLTLGDPDPLRAHAISQVVSFRTALAARQSYYSSETRWADAVFWRRRIERPVAI